MEKWTGVSADICKPGNKRNDAVNKTNLCRYQGCAKSE